MVIRNAGPADMHWMAALHASQLPHGFFVRLGRAYLRAYHRTFMQSPHAAALVAEHDGRPAGFIVGPTDAGEHHRFAINQRGLRLGLAGVVGLASHPAAAIEFARTRVTRYVRSVVRASRAAAPADQGARPRTGAPQAVLAHVAVEPAVQGKGFGRALVDAFVERARTAGAGRIELVTIDDDRGAAAFYESLGWTPEGASHRDGITFRRFALER